MRSRNIRQPTVKPYIAAPTLTALFLAFAGIGYVLCLVLTPERTVTMMRTHLIVPVVCRDALDHADRLVTLNGETVGLAARALGGDATDDELNDLLERVVPESDAYYRIAARCRNLAEPLPTQEQNHVAQHRHR